MSYPLSQVTGDFFQGSVYFTLSSACDFIHFMLISTCDFIHFMLTSSCDFIHFTLSAKCDFIHFMLPSTCDFIHLTLPSMWDFIHFMLSSTCDSISYLFPMNITFHSSYVKIHRLSPETNLDCLCQSQTFINSTSKELAQNIQQIK